MFTISTGIILLAVIVAVALVTWFLGKTAGSTETHMNRMLSSEKRMMRMMKRAGLDPVIATQGDVEAIFREVRSRCGKCESEDLCERWLAGKEQGDNAFCPNAQVFEELKLARAAAQSAK